MLGLLLVTLLVVAAQKLAHANPAGLVPIVKVTLGGGSLVLAGLLAFRGAVALALPLLVLGLSILGVGLRLPFGLPFGQRSAGQRSEVRTSVLVMELDHDSGQMDGEILTGEYAGRRLSELELSDLLSLRKTCIEAGDQSAALLDAYLQRAHPDWTQDEEAGTDQSGLSGGQMTAQEAYSILGLSPGASVADINKAHRRLMKQFHPDRGGSDYLAAKINQAKDLLLAER